MLRTGDSGRDLAPRARVRDGDPLAAFDHYWAFE